MEIPEKPDSIPVSYPGEDIWIATWQHKEGPECENQIPMSLLHPKTPKGITRRTPGPELRSSRSTFMR